MPKRLTHEQVRKKVFLAHRGQVVLDFTTYKDTHTKARFVDVLYGEWWAMPYDVMNARKGHKSRVCEKRKRTCLRKYGVESSLMDKKKMAKAMLRKYGVAHPMYSEKIKQKVKNTCMLRYGVENPTLNKDIASKVKNSLRKLHRENPEIALKSAKNANNITTLKHWASGLVLYCRGGYEVKVVRRLNKDRVDFLWQPKAFEMPDGRTYRPDLFLVGDDKWIEIKGYFWGDAREKWDWFHTYHSNSELWNEKKLKEMKIL